ncbi:MAG: MBL fold metallo-hydrolase [Candidatus Micrarchaeales archaeon]
MQLKFYGGAQEVGRSAILLKDERSFMFDYGIKIDGKIDYPTSIPRVDAFVLSHAHLDHSGFSPGLYEAMRIPAFGTPPTLRLSNLLLDDSLSIAKKQHLKARFHRRQVNEFVNRYVGLDYRHKTHFGNYDIEFYDAGHISGSAITLLERVHAKDYKRVVYTGDFKLSEQILHKGAEIVKSDLLIMESTYAMKEHPDRKKSVKDFIDKIKETLDQNGTALIPAFAVGRSQEILTMLHQNGLAQHTYLDGMAKDATSIILNHPGFINNADELKKASREAQWIGDRSERKEALNGHSIVLTTSGMLNGGPVMDYITKLNKNSHIFLTGFQQEGTNGRMLLDSGMIMAEGGKKKITNPVTFHDFSAHAGRSDLFEYVKKSSPTAVVCVHGSEDNAKKLASELKEQGYDAYAPKVGDSIKLGKD